MRWGDRLRKTRERLGYSKQDVAEHVGCSEHTVTGWERSDGCAPQHRFRAKLRDMLGCEPWEVSSAKD